MSKFVTTFKEVDIYVNSVNKMLALFIEPSPVIVAETGGQGVVLSLRGHFTHSFSQPKQALVFMMGFKEAFIFSHPVQCDKVPQRAGKSVELITCPNCGYHHISKSNNHGK